MCFKLILQVNPLNAGELKVLEDTHGTDPIGLLGGEVGLAKHTKKNQSALLHLLYILTSVWVLRTPNAGRNSHFQRFWLQKARKSKKFAAKNRFF